MVDLVGQYAKQTDQITRVKRAHPLLDMQWPPRPATPALPPRRQVRTLKPESIQKIIDAYESGATARAAAAEFGIARSTVVALLRRQGVNIRFPRVSETESADMVRLYQSGMSQVDIAKEFGRSKSVVWHVLKRAAMKHRP